MTDASKGRRIHDYALDLDSEVAGMLHQANKLTAELGNKTPDHVEYRVGEIRESIEVLRKLADHLEKVLDEEFDQNHGDEQ